MSVWMGGMLAKQGGGDAVLIAHHWGPPACCSCLASPSTSAIVAHCPLPWCSYISALLERMPTLASIQLTDFMGLVDPPALLAGAAPQAAAKPAALGTAAAREAAAAGLGGTSRAGTPGLLGAGAAVGSAAGGAAGSSLVGWRREVAETPVPGGISQYDVSFTRCC